MSDLDEKLSEKIPEPELSEKAPYRSPRLTSYGKVDRLTMGGGGDKGDGGGMTMA